MNDRLTIATAALQGMLAHPNRVREIRLQEEEKHWLQAVAEEALDLAEALIEAEAEIDAMPDDPVVACTEIGEDWVSIACPHCGGGHVHNYEPGDLRTHRRAHCHRGAYYLRFE